MDTFFLAERSIWFLMPLLLVSMTSLFLGETKWLPKKKLYIGAIILVVISVALGPISMCVDVKCIVIGALLFSAVFNLIILTITLVALNENSYSTGGL
jgi:hypothetical protein